MAPHRLCRKTRRRRRGHNGLIARPSTAFMRSLCGVSNARLRPSETREGRATDSKCAARRPEPSGTRRDRRCRRPCAPHPCLCEATGRRPRICRRLFLFRTRNRMRRRLAVHRSKDRLISCFTGGGDGVEPFIHRVLGVVDLLGARACANRRGAERERHCAQRRRISSYHRSTSPSARERAKRRTFHGRPEVSF